MSDCIEWVGCRLREGYGQYMTKQHRGKLAHRVAWEEANGPIPPGMIIMHTCDNPPCVNLKHLRLGTHAENQADMRAKGRNRDIGCPGELNSQARLTEEIVREIRTSTESSSAVAERFGITYSHVWLIRRHKTWKHVQDQSRARESSDHE